VRTRTRLSKEEAEKIRRLVEPAVDSARPSLETIERIAIDRLIRDLPPELAHEAARDFLNELGQELWTAFDLAIEGREPSVPSDNDRRPPLFGSIRLRGRVSWSDFVEASDVARGDAEGELRAVVAP